MQIGTFVADVPVVLAPMAGVTDAAFRRICREMGAGLTVGEMVASEERLRDTRKSAGRWRVDPDDPFPVIQILGADPSEMADAAQYAEAAGAKAVDINFGCPARMVCGKACGSALMQYPETATAIVRAVVQAVDIPVTVKMRTGWDEAHKNAVELAAAFEAEGARVLTVHGRTRAQRFTGTAEYETVRRVAQSVRIPVIVNGDADTPQKVLHLLKTLPVAGVMIGRAALGNPWIFARTKALLAGGSDPGEPDAKAVEDVLLQHLALHTAGAAEDNALFVLRSFRKHIPQYLKRLAGGAEAARAFVRIDDAAELTRAVKTWFETNFSICRA